MPNIITVYDRKRGCGWRKPGGLYLMGDEPMVSCGLFPMALCVCPVCGEGIKQTRSYNIINLKKLNEDRECRFDVGRRSRCETCLVNITERAFLIWVGEKFYRTAADYMAEALEQGISRRLAQLPREFKVGESVVALAHPQAVPNLEQKSGYDKGIIAVFKPQAVQYVVRDTDSDEYLEHLEQRGVTLVKVVRVDQNGEPISNGDDDGDEDED